MKFFAQWWYFLCLFKTQLCLILGRAAKSGSLTASLSSVKLFWIYLSPDQDQYPLQDMQNTKRHFYSFCFLTALSHLVGPKQVESRADQMVCLRKAVLGRHRTRARDDLLGELLSSNWLEFCWTWVTVNWKKGWHDVEHP